MLLAEAASRSVEDLRSSESLADAWPPSAPEEGRSETVEVACTAGIGCAPGRPEEEPEQEPFLGIISPNDHLLELRNRNNPDRRRIFVGLVLSHEPGGNLIGVGIDQPAKCRKSI